MIRVATAAEMRAADRRAAERHGLATLLLMENAGRGAVDAIERVLGPVRGRNVAVVCGKGQNGGDGFVAARHLVTRGATVAVWLVGRAEEVQGDAATNLAILGQAGLSVREVIDPTGVDALGEGLAGAHLAVDALLGTGLRGPATGLVAEAIVAVNGADRPVVSLDVPSGLSAERDEAPGPTIRARLTVTFGLPKLGLFLGGGQDHAGQIEIADVGLPRAWLEAGIHLGLVEEADVARVLPERPRAAHKGRFGHLLVVAGSRGKTGAAVLACLGALRGGVGLVTCAVPASQRAIVAAGRAEVMTEALPETGAESLAAAAADRVLELLAGREAAVLGPGIGLDPETQESVRRLVREVEAPLVVDADALTALVGQLPLVRQARGPRLLTPHPGEAARLLGRTPGAVQNARLECVRRLAAETGALVALKGAGTLVASPDGEVTLNPTGNPGMATGGTGDVLTGLAGSLLAQGVRPEWALRAAVYLHGLAGDLAAAARGPVGLLASDVAEMLPAAIVRVRGSR